MIKMPKTEPEYTESFNIRVSKEIKKKWESFTKENEFASISHMIRSTINDRINGILTPFKQNSEMSNRVKNLENENREFLKSLNEILKLLAQKPTVKEKPSYFDYQKNLILNLLREKPRNEKELSSVLGINDIDIMVLLNDLLELNLIKRSEKAKTKFEALI